MKWKVTGTWDFDGKPGTLSVEASNLRDAYSIAKGQGLTAIDATQLGHPQIAIPVAKNRRELGLSRGETWCVGLIGLLLSPAVIGIPLLVWAWLSQRRFSESA